MKYLSLMVAACASLACAVSAFAAVEWPTDFDAELAAHIAAEKSTNTTAEACSLSVDPCYRTAGSFDFGVLRTPSSGFYFILR